MTNKSTENLFIELGASLASEHPIRNIIIQNSFDEIEEHRKKYNNIDIFTTVFQYDNKDIRNANQQGSLYFDLDGQTAHDDAKALITFLIQQGCPEQSIRLFFSGNKGFHIEVVLEALGIQPEKTVNKVFGNIAKEVKEKNNLPSIYTAIYDQVRLWRLPNSINSKSGLYKIPLTLGEINLPLDAIKEMAKSPRLDFEYKAPELWTEFETSIYEKAKTLQVQVEEAKEPLRLKDAVGVEKGSRDDTMLKLACSMLKRNYNEPEVWEAISEINHTYKPPLDDASMKKIFRQAVKYAASDKSSTTTNNTYIGNENMSQDKDYDMPEPILLSELSSEQLSVSWVWEGFIALGHITLLAALFKAGKSTFIGQLLKALEKGTEFLGRRTIPCSVLILTEESKTQWVERRDELGLQTSPSIYILPNPMKMKLSYPDWVYWLAKIKIFCKEKGVGLVIIDTISEFWSVTDENKATEVTAALMPLNYLKEENIATLLVHHFRKSGGTQGTAARGSGAFAAKVDIMIDFTRYEDNELATKRKLSCLSRFEETPREVVIDYVNHEYIVLGSSDEVRKDEKLSRLLTLFKEYTEGFTVTQVFENWDREEYGQKPSKRTLQRYIENLIEANQVIKVEDKNINGKLVPFYKNVNPQQENQIAAESSPTQVKQEAKAEKPKQPDLETIHDKTTQHIDIKENVAGVENKMILILQERELFEKLQPLDKKSQEYAQLHNEWLSLRIKGEEEGLFFSIIPSTQDASVTDGVLIEPLKNKSV